MAVKSTLVSSIAVMKVKTGKKEGKDVFRKDSIRNLDTLAKDEDIFAVIESFKGLISYDILDVNRQNIYDLSKTEEQNIEG